MSETAVETRLCKVCRHDQNLDEFHKNSFGRRNRTCAGCLRKVREQRQNRTPETEPQSMEEKLARANRALVESADARKRDQRDLQLILNYGLTIEDLHRMYAACNGTCPICNNAMELFRETVANPPRYYTCVDHCHLTGKVRGLICFACNVGLGMFRDNTDSLANAINYLNRHHDQDH